MVRTKRLGAARTAATPTAASPAAAAAAVTANPKKRKNRRYAKKKPKPTTTTTTITTTTTSTTTNRHNNKPSPPPTAIAPSDTWRRIAIDPELVALREVEAEGEGSGLIALEEISGRAFKGRVHVATADDVRAAAEKADEVDEKDGGRKRKRKRSDLVPRLDVMDDEKESVKREHTPITPMKQQHDDDEEVEDEEAAMEEEMDGDEAEVDEEQEEDDQDGVEFDMDELNSEEDAEMNAATLEAQRILGQVRDEDDDEEAEEEVADEAEDGDTEDLPVKKEQAEEEEDEQDTTTTQSQLVNKLPRPDLSSPPPATAWDQFDLHPLILHSLHTLGFHTPTPVQSACLPPALLQRRDIIAAAETGSGKTLTFALPILNGLLLSPPAEAGGGVVALVLVPTRELALQVAMHVQAAAQYVPWVKSCVLVGGLSQQKQLRQLAAHPHILIATPGRLCELIVEGEVKGWQALRYLVLDEADRMVERGLGAEVQKVLTAIDRQRDKVTADGGKVSKLQHFFFSATLSLPEVGRENLKLKKRQPNKRARADGSSGNGDEDDEAGMVAYLKSLCSSMASSRPHVVDLTTKRRLVGGLSEYTIPCVNDDKDYYVYALLLQQPVNTKLILFVNAISCLRRLSSLLTLLTLPVYPLHAEMQQRQRLKNLDRFTATTTSAILLCTDVAARGLDLPAVPIVVHYQLPGSADVYIHRVGRTARAGRVGVSVALVSEEDGRAWHRINTVVRGASSDEEVERWRVEDRLMAVSRERMTVARKLDRLLNRQRQQKHTTDWLQRQALEMDMIVDDDILHTAKRQTANSASKRGRGGDEEAAEEAERDETRRLQKELSALLRRRMDEEKRHARFYTLNVVEEMEQRTEEQRKRLLQEDDEKRKKQKLAAPTTVRELKPKVVRTAETHKAKTEAAAESEQKKPTAASTEEQRDVKVETHSVEEVKQPNSATSAEVQQTTVRQPFRQPKTAPQAKQPAKQSDIASVAVHARTNGHKQPTEEKESMLVEPVQFVIMQPEERLTPAATISVGVTEVTKPRESTAQSSPITAGDAAGETTKLGKRAKKNLRKQKQKLAAAAAVQSLDAQPRT